MTTERARMSIKTFHQIEALAAKRRELAALEKKIAEREAKVRAAYPILQQLQERTAEERVIVAAKECWRVYWLRQGRLCAPLVGSLYPLKPVEQSYCSVIKIFDLTEDGPAERYIGGECLPADIPVADCMCGFRGVDNMKALDGIVDTMVNRPMSCSPIGERMIDDRQEADAIISAAVAAARENPGRAQAKMLSDWSDWMSNTLHRIGAVPALVKVNLENAVRADAPARVHRWLTTDPYGKWLSANTDLNKDNREYFGVWRAQRCHVIGPVIVGQYRWADPDPGDLEQFYGVRYIDTGVPFADTLGMVERGEVR